MVESTAKQFNSSGEPRTKQRNKTILALSVIFSGLIGSIGSIAAIQGGPTRLPVRSATVAESGGVLTPEQFGARGNMGEDGRTAMDATPGIQACLNAAVRQQSEFRLTDNVLTPAMRSHVISHAPFLRTVRFEAGAYYRITDTILIPPAWMGVIDGNGCYILWDGPPDKPMFFLQDNRDLRLMNFRLNAHQDRPCAAGIMMVNSKPASGPNITPTSNFFENIHMYGNAGGFRYGFRATVGSAGDNNNEMHNYVHCSVFDYAEAGWSIEHSQSKHHKMYGCQFQAGRTGKRGVTLRSPATGRPSSNGSFAWFGGGGGGNSICDFQLAAPLENILIQYAEIEQSRRLLCTSFDEVISGLAGTVPNPPSLTMATPGGSAYILGTTVVNPGFTFDYPPNSDTYDLLKRDGTVLHKSLMSGTAPFNFDGNTSWLQKVVTNGTQIVRVDRLGGFFPSPAVVATPTTIIGCRWSSDQEPPDGDILVYLQCGNLNLIGNRFYTKRQHARFRLLALDTQRQTKLLVHGNTFRCLLPAPWPSPRERMLMDRGDGSVMATVPWTGSWLSNANDPHPNVNIPTVDQTWRNGQPVPAGGQ